MSGAVFERILADSHFGEPASYIPAGGSENDRVTLTARVIRTFKGPISDLTTIARSEREDRINYRLDVRVLAAPHATYGGVSHPRIGDTWRVAITQGGELVDGWKAGAPQPGPGMWTIPLTLVGPLERRGKRRVGPQ